MFTPNILKVLLSIEVRTGMYHCMKQCGAAPLLLNLDRISSCGVCRSDAIAA